MIYFFSILRMMESGLTEKWFINILHEHEHRAMEQRRQRRLQSNYDDSSSISFSTTSMAQLEAEHVHNFGINDLGSVFILYLYGNLVACLVFLFRIGYNVWNNNNIRKKNQKRKRIRWQMECISLEQ